jgi:hypothetical protein
VLAERIHAEYDCSSWAPDGGSLCVTAAHEYGKPIALLLSRTSWAKVVDLVGHPSQLVACRFNPIVFGEPMAFQPCDLQALLCCRGWRT